MKMRNLLLTTSIMLFVSCITANSMEKKDDKTPAYWQNFIKKADEKRKSLELEEKKIAKEFYSLKFHKIKKVEVSKLNKADAIKYKDLITRHEDLHAAINVLIEQRKIAGSKLKEMETKSNFIKSPEQGTANGFSIHNKTNNQSGLNKALNSADKVKSNLKEKMALYIKSQPSNNTKALLKKANSIGKLVKVFEKK